MRKPHLVAVSVVLTLGISVALSTGLLGQNKENIAPVPKKTPDIDQIVKEHKEIFPVVEYSKVPDADPARQKKSQKYIANPHLHPEIPGNQTIMSVAELGGLSALPVEKSQLIVTGTVKSANAYLSENKGNVYSEFKIAVDQVFKNETGAKAIREIAVERDGGVVRFPSGYDAWVYWEGEGMPVVGKTYLFFLSYQFPDSPPQQKDLYILTAYEIANGRVLPLDTPDGGTHPIATAYKNKPSSVLFDDLKLKLMTDNQEVK